MLPAHRINQDTLSLATLNALTPSVMFNGLAEATRLAATERVAKLAGAKAQLRKAKDRGDQASVKHWQAEIAYLEK